MSENDEISLALHPILKLTKVTPELATELERMGYYTIESLAAESPIVLQAKFGDRKGFTLERTREIINEARSHFSYKMMSARDLLEEEKKKKHISTGSKNLDDVLGGGVRTGEITEIAGPYGVGKTEIVCTLAVNTISQLGMGVVVYDTEETFSAARLYEIAEKRGANPDLVLSQVQYRKIPDTDSLILSLENEHQTIKKYNVGLLAIDSLVSPFRTEYIGREMLAARQQKINRCIRWLLNNSSAYNFAAVITNQVISSPVPFYYQARPEELNPPVGGNIIAHGVNNRLYIRRAHREGKEVYIASLIDSSYLPRAETPIQIQAAGVTDIE